jgi:hypothetical protein
MKNLIIIMLLFTSCRSASDLVRAAQRKDPSIFDEKIKTKLVPITFQTGVGQIDCLELMKGNAIELYSPILVISGKDSTIKPIKARFKVDSTDTAKVNFEVDCPPVEVRTATITRTITLQASWKERGILIVL